MNDAIRDLEIELANLRKQRKEEKRTAKIESTWNATEKRFPSAETVRVLGWLDRELVRCWYTQGKFYRFDGTWFYQEKDRIEPSHWMPKDWLDAKTYPAYGPGIKNYLRYLWQRLVWKSQDMAYDLRPNGWGSKAQISKKVVFWQDASGKLFSGGPEYINAPKGLERIVCGSAIEAERLSSQQRAQESVEHNRTMEQRERVEGAMRDQWRSDARTLMTNARDNKNREFMRRALERNAERGNPWESQRTSFLHSEGFEDGR